MFGLSWRAPLWVLAGRIGVWGRLAIVIREGSDGLAGRGSESKKKEVYRKSIRWGRRGLVEKKRRGLYVMFC